jgi:FixJ family two-component response regulator
MRFNVHQGQGDDDYQKNKKLKEAYAFISNSLQKDYNLNNKIVVGTIKVDDHSRLTLSKKIKSVFPIEPEDTIVVYQDLINNDLLFRVQRHNEIIDTWTVKRQNNGDATPNYPTNTSTNTKTISIYDENTITNNDYHGSYKEELIKNNFNIMIIDDDLDILNFYKDLLLCSIVDNNEDKRKYNIEAFSSPGSALKQFIDANMDIKSPLSYDLIIIDVRMSFINGFQLYKLFHIIKPDVKSLFISAWDVNNDLLSLLPGIGSGDILKKPLETEYFISKVKEKLGMKETISN